MFYTFRRTNNDYKKKIKYHFSALPSSLTTMTMVVKRYIATSFPSWETKCCLPRCMTAINFFVPVFFFLPPSSSFLPFILKEKIYTNGSFCFETRCITHWKEAGKEKENCSLSTGICESCFSGKPLLLLLYSTEISYSIRKYVLSRWYNEKFHSPSWTKSG